MAKRWIDEPWAKNPEVLIESLERVYRLAIKAGKVQTPALTARKKAMAVRGWCSAVPQDRLLKAIEDLEMIYVPDAVAPGPGFLFPIRDVTGEIRRAHIRVNDDQVYGVRYISAVDKDRFIGPSWAGMDEETVEAIIKTGSLMVMEGPWDLLAIRTLEPRLPAVCSLTKKLGPLHFDYLRLIGVPRIYVMFDNEKKGKLAEEAMIEKHKDCEIIPVACPAHDPSDAMKSVIKMQALQRVLSSLIDAPSLIPEED